MSDSDLMNNNTSEDDFDEHLEWDPYMKSEDDVVSYLAWDIDELLHNSRSFSKEAITDLIERLCEVNRVGLIEDFLKADDSEGSLTRQVLDELLRLSNDYSYDSFAYEESIDYLQRNLPELVTEERIIAARAGVSL